MNTFKQGFIKRAQQHGLNEVQAELSWRNFQKKAEGGLLDSLKGMVGNAKNELDSFSAGALVPGMNHMTKAINDSGMFDVNKNIDQMIQRADQFLPTGALMGAVPTLAGGALGAGIGALTTKDPEKRKNRAWMGGALGAGLGGIGGGALAGANGHLVGGSEQFGSSMNQYQDALKQAGQPFADLKARLNN